MRSLRARCTAHHPQHAVLILRKVENGSLPMKARRRMDPMAHRLHRGRSIAQELARTAMRHACAWVEKPQDAAPLRERATIETSINLRSTRKGSAIAAVARTPRSR